MRALILAAGKGTRLKPLTDERAKPSLPLLGVPLLWFPAWHINKELQLSAFAINSGHAPESIRQACTDEHMHWFTNIIFHISDESKQILGSSGALWKLKHWVGNDLLAVMNGDTVCFPNWKEMLNFHLAKSASVTLHVRSFQNFQNTNEGYTDLQLDSSGKVLALNSKASSGTMFTGSYFIEPSVVQGLPDGVSELRPTVLEPLIQKGMVYAYKEEIDFLDLGTLHGYTHAQFDLLRRFPQTRELVELKLREVQQGVWIPQSWRNRNLPALISPTILMGELEQWEKVSSVFGPRFLGLEPPAPGMKIPFSNALVLSHMLQKL